MPTIPKADFQLISGANVWQLHATHGFPLEISIPMLIDQRQQIPIWTELFDVAAKDGTSMRRLIDRVELLLGDCVTLTPEQRQYMRERFDLLKHRYE